MEIVVSVFQADFQQVVFRFAVLQDIFHHKVRREIPVPMFHRESLDPRDIVHPELGIGGFPVKSTGFPEHVNVFRTCRRTEIKEFEPPSLRSRYG